MEQPAVAGAVRGQGKIAARGGRSTKTPAVEHALHAASLGIPVFRIKPNSKRPLRQGWQREATTDPAAIRRLWSATPNANIGWAMGAGLCALDVDNKNGKCGDLTLAGLQCDQGFLPQTLTNETPTGGRHLVMRTGSDVSNSAERLGEGLDVRGRGGYVVGAGSVIDGKPYRAKHATIAEAPGWFCSLAGKPVEKQSSTPLVEQDTEDAIARARRYLLKEAPIAIEGSGGDATTVQVAMRLRDLAVSEPQALELLLDHWNDRCSPPWMPDELERKVANAYRYAKLAPGNSDPMADFEPIELESEAAPARLAHKLVRADQITVDLEDRFLLEGFINRATEVIVFGKPKSGKSLFVMDIAAHIAAGRPWAGLDVEQGAVLYYVLEGFEGAKERLGLLCEKHTEWPRPLPLYLCGEPLRLANRSDRDRIVSTAKEVERDSGTPCRLVVIDTLKRALGSLDENSSKELGAASDAADEIIRRTGATVLLVHHEGKADDNGPRGSNVLEGNADTLIQVTRRKGGPCRFKAWRQKDLPEGKEVEGRIVAHSLGTTPRGKTKSTAYMEIIGSAQDEFPPIDEAARDLPRPGTRQAEVLDELNRLTAAARAEGGPTAPWISQDEVVAACRYGGKTEKNRRDAFRRDLSALVAKGLAEIEGNQVRIV